MRETELAGRLAAEVARQGGRVYYVGGCVRDRRMGVETKDVDVEVYGIAPARLREILSTLGEVVEKGASFGELILTNYDPRPYMTRQLNLFDESLGEWELKLVHIPNHPPRRKGSPAGCRVSNQNLLQ